MSNPDPNLSLSAKAAASFGSSEGIPALSLEQMSAENRMRWAYREYGDALVTTSSFGIQSLIMLELLKKTDLPLKVLSIDIPHPAFDAQRAYRDVLQRHYRFDLRIITASKEDDKQAVMSQFMSSLGAKAALDGNRASQTKERSQMGIISTNKAGIIEIHPISDWPDTRVDYFIQQLLPALRHPEYKPGARSKGGRVLNDNEEKTECGMHI